MRSINGAVLRSAFAMVLGFVFGIMAGSSHNLSGYHDRYTIHFTGIIRYPQLFHPTEKRERGKTDVSYRGSGKRTVRSVVGDHARVLREYINVHTRSLIGNCRCTAIGFIDIREEMEQCTVGLLHDAGFDLDNRSNDSCLPVRGGGKYIRYLRCSQHLLRGL